MLDQTNLVVNLLSFHHEVEFKDFFGSNVVEGEDFILGDYKWYAVGNEGLTIQASPSEKPIRMILPYGVWLGLTGDSFNETERYIEASTHL